MPASPRRLPPRSCRGQGLTEFVLLLSVSMVAVLALSKINFAKMHGIYERQRLLIVRQLFIF